MTGVVEAARLLAKGDIPGASRGIAMREIAALLPSG